MDNRFTASELLDLALVVPEVGAVNFNILYAVLKAMLVKLDMAHQKPPCYIRDPVTAQAAVTRAKLAAPPGGEGRRSASDTNLEEVRDRVRTIAAPPLATAGLPDDETTPAGPSESTLPEDDVTKDGSSVDGLRQSRVTQRLDVESDVIGSLDVDDPAQAAEAITIATNVLRQSLGAATEDAPVLVLSLGGVPSASITEVEEVHPSAQGPVPHPGRTPGLQQEWQPFHRSSKGMVIDGDKVLAADPVKLMTEIWRATNINRRMDGAEHGLREMSSILDAVVDKLQELEVKNQELSEKAEEGDQEMEEKQHQMEEKCDTLQELMTATNEEFKQEMQKTEEFLNESNERLEEMSEALKEESVATQALLAELSDNMVKKPEVEEMKVNFDNTIREHSKKLKQSMTLLKDSMIPREEFNEATQRLEIVEQEKINKEELGPLLQEGFIDGFLSDLSNLKADVKELQEKYVITEGNLDRLTRKVDQEISATIQSHYEELTGLIGEITKKLDTIDADEIFDSIAKLEDQAEMTQESLNESKSESDRRDQEVKTKFRQVEAISTDIKSLQDSKADLHKVKEMLEVKADVTIVRDKLDTKEFFTVMGATRDIIDRMTARQDLDEERSAEAESDIRRELTLKMYSEDFVTATEPLNHRIAAIIVGLRKVQEISLANQHPGAAGIAKCVSCARGADLSGTSYQRTNEYAARGGGETIGQVDGGADKSDELRLPDIADITPLKVPSSTKPTITDPLHLPLLFASAKPHVGLAHRKSRNIIRRQIENRFATKPIRSCGGVYTRTLPHQRGVAIKDITLLPATKKLDLNLIGIDKHVYRGTDDDGRADVSPPAPQAETRVVKETEIASLKPPRRKKGFIEPVIRRPRNENDFKTSTPASVVSLCVNSEVVNNASPVIVDQPTIGIPAPIADGVQKSGHGR